MTITTTRTSLARYANVVARIVATGRTPELNSEAAAAWDALPLVTRLRLCVQARCWRDAIYELRHSAAPRPAEETK